MVLQRSMLNWRRGWGQSAIGICAFCYTYPDLPVDLPSLVYGIQGIYVWLKGVDLTRSAKFGAAVFKASMLNWLGGQSPMGIYALCYIWNVFVVMFCQRSMLNWRIGVGSFCHRYMCIVLYIYIWKLFGVMVFQRSMLNWRRGWDQSAIGICAFCYTYPDLPVDLPSLV